MEEKQKVWIKGRKGCGKEIIDTLTQLGADGAFSSCEEDNYIYFITHNGKVCGAPLSFEVAALVMDNYKEIELPRQEWKDGDVLICDKWPGQCAVFKKYREDDVFEAYLTVDEGGVSLNATAPVEVYHLASGKEFEVAAKTLYTVARKLFEVSKKLKK